LKDLAGDLMARRLVIQKRDGNALFEAPLVAGLGAMIVLGPWTAVGVAVALLTDHSILVRRRQPAGTPPEPDEEIPVTDEPGSCHAVTKAGTPCKLPAQPGSDYCHIHQPVADN
jgi:hypothetical protein